MGCARLQSDIKTIKEEVQEGCDDTETGPVLSCMINSEVGTLLAVMRRNVRWGSRYLAGDNQLDHYLIHSLKILRKQMFSWGKYWQTIDPVIYLQPFLDVIRSNEIGAPITGVALSSVNKILNLGILDLNTLNIDNAMHLIVDSVTLCRFEVTDAASEEVILMRILQVLLGCLKCKASSVLTNQHICTVVNTCFRVVHQAENKGELLQRISRHTMHELVRCIFSHLQNVEVQLSPNDAKPSVKSVDGVLDKDHAFRIKPEETSIIGNFAQDDMVSSVCIDKNTVGPTDMNGIHSITGPYGFPCAVEIFQFLCSLLNVSEHIEMGSTINPMAFEEDIPLFALGLINSAIELGGPSIQRHPKLLSLVQDELFQNLMQFGLSMSPLVISMVCSIVLNLYHHLHAELKLQLEAFFSCVILRLTRNRHPASYQQYEVAMEALVDFCRQKNFMAEMYANLDCDITCSNVFESLANLLSKSAFPINCPLSPMHLLAFDGLLAVIQGMADRIVDNSPLSEQSSVELEEYTPFWTLKCENYSDPDHWVRYVRRRKYIKRRLMIGADHFNRDPKKGLEFLQGTHLLPEKLDPQSVACFFRYTSGLDKNLVGDFLGNHDEFCVQVLHEFARTFDFQNMRLDTALRLFLETFRLPGESQKIHRVLEAFSERYYEQSPHILANKDAALVLSYSLIMLNTDQHNVQVKKKMSEEDFVRNNRSINGGNDLPREYLSELYHAIYKNELRTIPEQGLSFPEMTPSRWIDLMQKSKNSSPYISYNSHPFLDRDMFAIMSGPTIAAISVIFDNSEQEEVFHACVDGFLSLAKISACHHLEDVLDDLLASLCKFTTPTNTSSVEEPVTAFGDDLKARLATETIFNIATRYGDFIRTGWRNLLDCILMLHKLGILPARVASDAADYTETSVDTTIQEKPILNSQSLSQISTEAPYRSSGLMGRFSQLLSLDTEEPRSQPTEQQLAAHQRTVQTIQKCSIDSIFTESKFLHTDSLLHLARALILAAGRPQKNISSHDDEDTAVFCLELLIAVTLNNRDRIVLLWQFVYDHIASIVQSTVMPCPLVEKAVFGLLKICQRLLPYREELVDDLLKSLQLILKLDARVADAYCENITQEVTRLVKTNGTHIKSQIGWKTITDLLSITARHPEASEVGFEALVFIMSEGTHLSPANYILCVDAARQFAESRVGLTDRSVQALDMMAESVACIVRWSLNKVEKSQNGIAEMWLKVIQGLKRVCLDQREDVRNHALLSLQRCTLTVDKNCLSPSLWVQSFDLVIFLLLNDLLEIAQAQSPKEYKNMEASLVLAIKLLSKLFLHLLKDVSSQSSFPKIWLGVLNLMEKYTKVKLRGKRSEKLQELIPELLKNILLMMKSNEILVKRNPIVGGDNSLWDLTWLHVIKITPSLQSEIFPGNPVRMEVVGLAGLLSELGVVGNSNRRNQATTSTETETETAVLSSSSITALQTLIDETDGAQLWDYLSECNIQPSVLVASLAASMESKSSYLSLLASRAYLSALLSSSAPIHTLFDPFTFFSLLFSLRHSTKSTVPSDGSRSQSLTLRERKKKRKGRSGEKSAEEEEHTEVDGLLIFVLELVESSMSIVRLDRMTDGVKSLVETVVVVLESGIVQRLRRISDICFGILYETVVRPEHGDQTESSAQVLRSLSPVMLSHSKSGLKSEVIQFVLRRLMPFGKGNEKVRKALVYLPRYLSMTAPEKTELRACAVDTILAILRVMEMEDQIGFVEYVVKMCNSKESLRLLGLDILLMILMAYDVLGVRRLENDQGDDVDCHLDVKKCFEVIVQRCSDSVARIRSRALVNTGQAIEFLSKDSKNHSWLQKTMMHTSFNNLLRMRCVDDKAAVRKSTLVLIMKSTTLSGVSIDEEVLKMMAHACSDPLLSIRKAALLALSEVFRKNVESKIITTWLHAVPPLIMDNETSIQEECANLFLELILDWISRVGFVKLEDNIQNLEISFPSSLLALMKEMCDEEITMNIKKICTSLGKKNKLKVSYAIALQNIITASEMAWKNSNIAIEKWIAPPGAWMLLSELSPFVSKAIGWKFLHHHWKLLDKENEVASHGDLNETELVSATWITDRVSLLQIISNVSMGLPQEASADLAYNLLKRIEGFNMHLTEVDAHVKALKTLCKKKAEKPGEGDVLVLKWVDQVKSKALNIFETYLSKNSAANDLRNSVTPRATKKKESEETSKVVNAIFVIGSLVLICPSADFKAVIPLLHSIMTSKTSKGKPKRLAGLIDSLKEVASSLYIQSWVTMGKICLVDGKLAARYIPLFVQELESNSAAMRNNILLVMGDFCVQHTALVDCYIPRIANLLRDPCEIIRMQTFTLLSRLMQRDYVKWRGVLFLQFLLLLVDESEKIRNLADYLFGSILKVKAPLLAYNSFVEAIFVLNDCHTHSGHSAKSKTKVQNFSLRGNDATSRSKRMHIYVSLLKQMAPEQLLATSAKLCAEILASASDGMLNLDDITAQCVLQDSLEILACKEMRIQVPRASDTTDMDEEGEVRRSLLEARGRAVTQVSKKNLIQHAVPIFIELKRLLENRNSSLTGCLMECLCVLLKDYKNEIDDILVADKQLQKELIYDMQKYEAAKTRNKVNNAIRRTNGLVSPANLRTSVADLSEKLGTATKITSAVADVAAKAVARSVMKDINGNMPTPSVHTMSIPKVKTSIVNGSRTTLPMDVLQSLRKRQVADFDAVA